MSLNYISSSFPPTAVTASVVGNFNASNEIYLVIAKYNRLEMYLVTETGLKPRLHFNIYGRITNLAKFHRKRHKDYLIMLTESLNVSVLEYNAKANVFITCCGGVISDEHRRTDSGYPILKVDPTNQFALIRVFDGIIKVIQLDLKSSNFINMFDIRVNELFILDINFLSSTDSRHLHLGIIYKDRISCNFRSYLLRTMDMELLKGPFEILSIEQDSSLILPLTNGRDGALIVGKTTVMYASDGEVFSVSPPEFYGEDVMISWCQIGSRKCQNFLVADSAGNLYVVSVNREVLASYIGNVAYPTTLNYIDNGVVFIGSSLSDSQLIELLKEPVDGSCVRIVETFINIGPIIDMKQLDSPNYDVPRLITCSGVEKWGSLRVLTNGIHLNEIMKIPLQKQTVVFSLKLNYPGNGLDDALLVSSYYSTMIFVESNGLFLKAEYPCFIYDRTTLYAVNVVDSRILQVTPNEMRLIDLKTMTVQSSWTQESRIHNVDCNGWYVIISSYNKVYLFSISNGLQMMSHNSFEDQVSALALTKLSNVEKTKEVATPPEFANVMAISFWKNAKIQLYLIPNFDLLAEDQHDDRLLFKSLHFIEVQEGVYLFAALSTGELFTYFLSDVTSLLSSRTKTHIAGYPITLIPFRQGGSSIHKELVPGHQYLQQYPPLGEPSVFICTDRPAIAYHRLYKIGFSYIDKHKIEYFCTYNSSRFPESAVVLTNDGVIICQIGDNSSCGVLTIPIYESPRKIAYHPETSTIAIITVRTDSLASRRKYMNQPTKCKPLSVRYDSNLDLPIEATNVESVDVSSFIIMDSNTYDPICANILPIFEITCSLTSFSTPFILAPLFAVGTGITTTSTQEPTQGRVILYQYYNREVTIAAEHLTRGPVYDIICRDDKLICCVSQIIEVLAFRSDNTLSLIAQVSNNVTSILCKSFNNCIVVGDLIRGLSVFKAHETTSELVLEAKSGKLDWLTAFDVVDEDTYLFSNVDGCICVAKRTSSPTNARNITELTVSICYHVDQQVNVFKKGSLSNKFNREKLISSQNSIIFGTASGMIGTILDIPSPWDSTLLFIQTEIIEKLESVGDIDYNNWRNKYAWRHKAKDTFIDGDIIDGFSHLNLNVFKQIVSKIPDKFSSSLSIEEKVDQMTAIVAELSRSRLN